MQLQPRTIAPQQLLFQKWSSFISPQVNSLASVEVLLTFHSRRADPALSTGHPGQTCYLCQAGQAEREDQIYCLCFHNKEEEDVNRVQARGVPDTSPTIATSTVFGHEIDTLKIRLYRFYCCSTRSLSTSCHSCRPRRSKLVRTIADIAQCLGPRQKLLQDCSKALQTKRKSPGDGPAGKRDVEEGGDRTHALSNYGFATEDLNVALQRVRGVFQTSEDRLNLPITTRPPPRKSAYRARQVCL